VRAVELAEQSRNQRTIADILGVSEGKLYALVRPTSLTALDAIQFLRHLLCETAGRLLVIWDVSLIHRDQGLPGPDKTRRVELVRLPPYASDLNPTEELWPQLKHVELRNLACMDLDELHFEFHLAIDHVRQRVATNRAPSG
jgi:hypothetical protein